ncbi:MAG: tetratricopeptide repeat protein [Acidobacteria bacterium]|nr:tetratricopeptide repeat protein [Acidobacteriota bacterium]
MIANILLMLIFFWSIHPQGTTARQSNPAGMPGLPVINFDDFGPGIKEQIRKAYDDARMNPNDALIVGRLAMILHAYQDYGLAASLYERASLLHPDEFKWTYLQATCQASVGKNTEAIASLRAAIKKNPDYLPARLKLADALLAMNQLEDSGRFYAEVIARQPAAPQAYYGLGRIKSKLGDHDGAIESLKKACQLAPTWGAAHYALALAYRNSSAGEGNSVKVAGHLKIYQRHMLVRPLLVDQMLDAVAGLNLSASDSLNRGVVHEAAGRLDESIAEHERAMAINPQLIQAHINLIQLYARTSQTAKAEERYRSVIAFNPNLAEAHYNIGVMYLGQKRIADASQAFQRAIDSNPQFAEAHLNYGLLLEQEKSYDEALSHYRQAVEHGPNLREAHFQLARMLIFKGVMPEAIEHLKLTLTPEDDQTPRYTYALAAAYARAGDRVNGLKYARIARDKAATFKQTELLAQIERDLKILEPDK